MASKSLGTLTLDLVAKIGGYTAGLDKAEKEAQKRAKAIQNAFDQAAVGVGVAFGAIAAAGAGLAAGFQAAITSLGNFQDLAEKTGASAEGLASFSIAAGIAGTSIDEIANASVKLTKNLTGVDDESKAAGAAIAALGLNLQDFKKLAPEDQIDEIAKALGNFEEGAGKTAVALDLFGKSGAELLPFLKALNEEGGRQVIITQEMIEQADAYSDAQAKATAQLKVYAQVLAAQALPYVTAFTGALTDTIKEVLGLDKGTTDLANNKGVQDFAENAVRALGFVVDAVDGLIRTFEAAGKGLGGLAASAASALSGDFRGAGKILSELGGDLDAILNRELFSSKLNKRLNDIKNGVATAAASASRPTLNYAGRQTGGGGRGGAAKDPTAEAQRYLESLQKQLEKTTELTVQEQALRDIQMGRLGQVTSAQKEQILAVAGQIDALKAQKKAEEDMKKYKEAVDKVNLSLLEMQGNASEAAAIKFDQENSALYLLFSQKGDDEMKRKLDYLKQLTVAAAQFAQEQQKVGKVQSDLDRAESRIQRDIELGTSGQIDGLVKLGEARQKAVAGMKESYAEFQKLQASGVQFTSDQKRSMEQLKNEIEDLSTRLDPLAEKFNNDFANKFSDAFGSIIDGSKSVKDALKDMINSFISDLAKLAAQDVFKSLISGGGSATGGAGFNIGSLLSSIFGGGRANGGPVSPNSLYRVNENGPELFQAANGEQYLMTGPKDSGHVIPNAGGGTQIVNFNLQGEMRKTTQMQAAGEVRRQTNKAALRGYS